MSFPKAARWLAWLTTIAGAVVFVLAAHRARGIDVDRLVREMPVVELSTFAPRTTLGAITFELREMPNSGSCSVTVTRPDGDQISLGGTLGPHGGCPVVRIRHDAIDELVVVEHIPLWSSPFSDNWQFLTAISTHDGFPVTLDAHAFRARRLVVPATHAALAAFSAALAFALLLPSLRMRRREERFGALTDAEHIGGGWFAIPDGRRFRSASAKDFATGDFSVRVTEPAQTPDYRGSAAATVEPVEAGAASEHTSSARGLAWRCEAVALAFAACGMAPALDSLLQLT